jgi:hypothetical protein
MLVSDRECVAYMVTHGYKSREVLATVVEDTTRAIKPRQLRRKNQPTVPALEKTRMDFLKVGRTALSCSPLNAEIAMEREIVELLDIDLAHCHQDFFERLAVTIRCQILDCKEDFLMSAVPFKDGKDVAGFANAIAGMDLPTDIEIASFEILPTSGKQPHCSLSKNVFFFNVLMLG